MATLIDLQSKHFAYIDLFSYGAIFNLVNANNPSPIRNEETLNGQTVYFIDPKANNLPGLFLPNIVYIGDSKEWYYLW